MACRFIPGEKATRGHNGKMVSPYPHQESNPVQPKLSSLGSTTHTIKRAQETYIMPHVTTTLQFLRCNLSCVAIKIVGVTYSYIKIRDPHYHCDAAV